MPQMAPLSWLILFSVFTISFLLFCTMNYFSSFPSPSKSGMSGKVISHSLSWKW